MRPSQRLTPLVTNSAAALLGMAVLAVLVRATMLAPDAVAPKAPIESAQDHREAQLQRFAFVRPDAFSSFEPEPDMPQLRPTFETKAEAPAGSWSTEIHQEPATQQSKWRFTLLPSLRVPLPATRPANPPRNYTLKARLAEISPTAMVRLAAKFEAAKATWPPAEIALVAIKDEKALELHARPSGGAWKPIHRYRVLAASGGAGPKLRQGDRQVPEGIYGIAFLNPNSAYHVSLRVNYPNAFDRQMATKDGRRDLGGDIMIHGKNLSAGCLAMGDEAVEEIFVLAAQMGLSNVKLIISPTDFRQKGLSAQDPGQPQWLPKLYAEIATAMSEFQGPRATGLLSLFMK